MARPFTPLIDRIADKFLVGDGCWRWTASINAGGYGQINGGHGRPVAAHRVLYELLVGPIPAGLFIDHLCRNRWCVRPDHLEPVTHAENVRRGVAGQNRVADAARMTHCKWGHEFSEANTGPGRNANGRPCRVCRRCKADRQNVRNAAMRQAKELARGAV